MPLLLSFTHFGWSILSLQEPLGGLGVWWRGWEAVVLMEDSQAANPPPALVVL